MGELVTPPWITRRRLDVGEYYRMADAGVLRDGERVELIGGEVVEMSPIGPQHSEAVMSLNERFSSGVAGRARVAVQAPIRLDELNEPQPDLALLRRRPEGYGRRHPGPADVFLIIEVAASSLRFDRTVKLPLYRQHGIPGVWIVDVKARRVDVCRQPTANGYAQVASLGPDAVLELAALPGLSIRVGDVLGDPDAA